MKVIMYAEMYQNRAAGCKFDINEAIFILGGMADILCSSKKQQPDALWDLGNNDTSKGIHCSIVLTTHKEKNCLLYAKLYNSGLGDLPNPQNYEMLFRAMIS